MIISFVLCWVLLQCKGFFGADSLVCVRREENGAAKVTKNRAQIARYGEVLRGHIAAAAANAEQHAAVLNWPL